MNLSKKGGKKLSRKYVGKCKNGALNMNMVWSILLSVTDKR